MFDIVISMYQFRNYGFISSADVSCALSRNTSALIDKLLNIIGVESQRASSGSHFDTRQIWLAFTGGVLDDP